jgi:L-ascorbate metabolism protein UlaG (beta-lactamase superfamily)
MHHDSPYFREGRFHNMDDVEHATLRDVLAWKLGLKRNRALYDDTPLDPIPAQPPDLGAFRGATSPCCLWLGHATVLVKLDGLALITDPVLHDLGMIRRGTPAPLDVSLLPDVDILLLSHNHRDHLELGTIRAIQDRFPSLRILAPLALGEWLEARGLRHTRELGWWSSFTHGPLRLVATPAQHWSRYSVHDADRTHWCSWYVQGASGSFYFAGDSGYFAGFDRIHERLGSPDVALMPIGAYQPRWIMHRQHMNPEEAIQAWRDLRARHLIAIHWGTYALSDEPLGQPPAVLRRLAGEQGLEEHVHVLPHGGIFHLREPSRRTGDCGGRRDVS